MAYDDFDPYYDDEDERLEPGGLNRWRPQSRAGRASVALAVVSAFSISVAGPMISHGMGLGLVALAVTCFASLVGLLLGIGGLLQTDQRRGYALLGTVFNACLLAFALVIAAPDAPTEASPKGESPQSQRSLVSCRQRQV